MVGLDALAYPGVDGTEALARQASRILSLPPELQLVLSRFLDVASLIVYSSLVCKSLSVIFSSFQRIHLFLVPAHRLSLAEWRRAAIELQRIGIVAQPRATKDEPGIHRTSETLLASNQSVTDLNFLLGVLRFLAGRHKESPASDRLAETPSSITSLSVVSWHGVAGHDLIGLLNSHSLLVGVNTIVKTDRLDHKVWFELTRSVSLEASNGNARVPVMDPFADAPTDEESLATAAGAHQFRFTSCSATQVLVQVGKLRKAGASERRLKGEGLQIGFEGLCLEERESSTNDSRQDSEPPRTGYKTPMGVEETELATKCVRRRLHVIFQGRFEATEDESLQIDELFRQSLVTCACCRQRIVF